MNSNTSIICQSHHNQIYKVQHQKGSRSLASKCPQRISGLSAPERDVTRQRTYNQPMESHTHVNSTSYTIPLDPFTGMTNNVATILDQLLVGSTKILPLYLGSSTLVSQDTPICDGSAVITQDHIGTPLPLRSNPSLPPGYNALNTSIYNPSENPSLGPNVFVPPGYNVASSFVPTPTQVLSGGPNIPPPPSPGGSNHLGPSISNKVGGTIHSVSSSF
jgi:hypothetical protein